MPTHSPLTCGLVEGGWTTAPPTSSEADCDDTEATANPRSTWFADCDKDGYAVLGAARVLGCKAPKHAPTTCSAGGWTRLVPTTLDVDCDDTDATKSPTTEWYADCDGDEFASVAAKTVALCTKPETAGDACQDAATASWTRRAPADTETADCDDARATVNPSVVEWTNLRIDGQTNLNVDFDFNCDGAEENAFVQLSGSESACESEADPALATCAARSGWTLATLPTCGSDAGFVSCALDGVACVATLEPAHVQSCR
jgi:hypothetical protein